MSHHNVDIMGLAETNINWNITRNNKATKLLRKNNQHSVLINTTSDELSSSLHKPGGASIALTGNVVGAIDSKHIDDKGLGRWVFCVLNAKHNRKIVIITA